MCVLTCLTAVFNVSVSVWVFLTYTDGWKAIGVLFMLPIILNVINLLSCGVSTSRFRLFIGVLFVSIGLSKIALGIWSATFEITDAHNSSWLETLEERESLVVHVVSLTFVLVSGMGDVSVGACDLRERRGGVCRWKLVSADDRTAAA